MITLFCIRPKGFNIGNDVIFLGLQHFLYESFGQVVNVISLPATSRYESQAKAGLTAKTIHEINQYGHGVIIGGGNLYENGELEVNLDALDALEVPLMLFSLSRGRMYNRHLRMVARTDAMPDRIIIGLHRKAKYSLARDTATFEYLQGIGCEHAVLGGCPTVFLDRMTNRLPQLADPYRDMVLISVRTPGLMNVPLRQQSRVYTDITAIIDFLRGQGHQDIRLLCHDHRDIPFAASFPNVDYVYTDDVYTLLALLQTCALNVSYRLHAALPCLAFGTPVIKISYDERSISMLETVGFGDWNIDMVHTENIVNAVAERYKHLDSLCEQRASAKTRWDTLYSSMIAAFRGFAADVREYQDGTRLSAV